ncbi:MAG: SDR family NAD(P)-dependent oxidoreductase, partial [Leptolyngbya sp. SIO3F4]|nr:SDR family NAD(P)-dependent oxidoreductase [Leptolyngbya sp. SIO3F4]
MNKISAQSSEQLQSAQNVLLALRNAKNKLKAIKQAKTEPIAIIGLGCRFPKSNSPADFWRLLEQGMDAVTEVPAERWDIDQYYDPDPEVLGKMHTRHASFLSDVDQFDADFFKISPREAKSLDPQHRLLLEVCWESLEDAGVSPLALKGTQTGVFIGMMTHDYGHLAAQTADIHTGFGNGAPLAAGRIAYTLGLNGPTLTVETACSSSLVACHLACQSLRNQESNLALVGGINLMLTPEMSILEAQAQMNSPDGRCKTFDEGADGYGRGEGCGIVVLKRLSDAQADGDRILGSIRGSAINHDGSSSGLTVPNGLAQKTLIEQALTNANVQAAQVDYVECHGTGTALGDPIEVDALVKAYGQHRALNHPIMLGSVKTNIGHTEGAAGIAGLIKIILSLQHEKIPPHLHLKQPNRRIAWDDIPVVVPTAIQPWPRGEKTRLAGVSSFGVSGTNAHVIVEEAPLFLPMPAPLERPWHVLTLSAKTENALQGLIEQYERYFNAHPELALADIGYTVNTGRAHFQNRLAIAGTSLAEVSEKLRQVREAKQTRETNLGQFDRRKAAQIALLFTGQGSQYVGMARELYETQPTFRQTLEQCSEILNAYLDRPLLDVLYPDESPDESTMQTKALLHQTAYTQPALFAIEYALYQLWQSWGIVPSVVIGHSIGELVAACVAGVFSLEDGLKLSAMRGKLMQQLPAGGAMISVMASVEQVSTIIADSERNNVEIAAINGPESTVISGEASAVQSIAQHLEAQGIKTKQLQVSHAFHSPLMAPMLAEFEQVAQQISYSLPQLKLISNVTGQVVTEQVATPEYWCEHILAPVNFAAGMECLQHEEINILLECGPQAVLLGMGRQCLPEDEEHVWLPSLRPGQGDWQQMLSSLGELYVRGVTIDWEGFEADYPQRRKVSLPTYPFQRQRYWVETQPGPTRMMAARDRIHPLLGQRLQLAGRCQDIFFETSLSAASPAYLSDHRVLDKVILPGAAYVEMVLATGSQIFQSPRLVLEQVFMAHPLILSATQTTTVQVVLSPTEKGVYTFEVASLRRSSEADSWQVHASGKLRAGATQSDLDKVTLEQWNDRGSPLPLEPFYRQSKEQGLAFGECFRSLTQAWIESGEGYAQVQLPLAVGDADNYHLHPILLDGGFQLTGAMLAGSNQTQSNSLYLPVAIERLEVYGQAGQELWVHGKVRDADTGNSLSSDFRLIDSTGSVVAQVEGFTVRQVTRQGLQRALEPDLSDWFYTLDWRLQPLERSHPPTSVGRWLVFTSGGELGEQLLQQLQQKGYTCLQVTAGSSYQRLSDAHYQVSPLEPNDFQLLLQACCHEQLKGIIHLWSLESSTVAELDVDSLQQSQGLSCGSVLHLLQGLSSAQAVPLYLVTQGAQSIRSQLTEVQVQQAPLWGLGRVIALEYPAIKCQRLDLDPNASVETNVGAIAAEISNNNSEDQVAYRQNQRFVARLLRQRDAAQRAGQRTIPQGQPYQLKLSAYGSPDNLSLQPITRRSPAAGEVEVQMQAVGLNFRDVLNALGVLKNYYAEHFGITDPQQLTFGFEGVGRVVALGAEVTHLQIGDQVIVTMIPDGLSSHVTTKAAWVFKKPPKLSAAEAATLPLVCLTAQYGLSHLAQLQPGERVLIHAAAGGVGQAAVQIAQRLGAEIYATASPGKWAFLRSQGIQHIFNSRSLAFADQIKQATGGVGVDVVLNSLNGDHIPKSLDVLATGGRFIEIGKAGIWTAEQVRQRRPDVAYFPFDLGEVGQANPPLLCTIFEQFQKAVTEGDLKSLRQQVYPITQVVEAFRLMQRGQHMGKVVVTLPDVETAETGIQSEGSYLITGGLGALGLQVAQALADQGARSLVLMGRRSPSEQAQTVITALQTQGVTVSVELADVADFQSVAQIMTKFEAELPPLRGVIHAAGVLADRLLQQMSWSSFTKVLAPKVMGAWNLHQLTQQQPLDFFVCFSSITALMGNATQGNYAAANTFLDALAHHRRVRGLPGLSINWGPWAADGMAASLGTQHQNRLQALGLTSMTPQQGVN